MTQRLSSTAFVRESKLDATGRVKFSTAYFYILSAFVILAFRCKTAWLTLSFT